MNICLPQSCLSCNRYGLYTTPLCKKCYNTLTTTQTHCPCCANAMPRNELCARCLQQPPAYDRIYAGYPYQSPIDSWINQFKHHQKYHMAPWLADLWLRRHTHRLNQVDLIVPIPLHRSRLRQRGYNQAALLAQSIGEHLNIPVSLNTVKKSMATPSQTGLSAAKRQRLPHQAFTAQPMQLQSIALVDDVMTTGSTLNAVATCLKKQGVQRVYGWVIARTTHN